MKLIYKILLFVAIFLILTGIGIIFFPNISNIVYEKKVNEMEEDFITSTSKKNSLDEDNNVLEKLYQELKTRNDDLYKFRQNNLVDPFSYEQPSIDLSEYGIFDNIIGYIYIPKIEITLPILLGANYKNLKNGAVHLTETSYPIGGINTNSVIAAHRGWGMSKMFRNLDKLEIGDIVYIQNFKEELKYEVSEIKIIDPDDIDELLIQDNKDMISLVTCHPYRINTKRYVVYCYRSD